jgi:hypothetical protein
MKSVAFDVFLSVTAVATVMMLVTIVSSTT